MTCKLPLLMTLAGGIALAAVSAGAHHGDWEPGFERDYLERVRAWFDKYLK